MAVSGGVGRAALCLGSDRAEAAHITPRVLTRVGVARHHRIGDVVTDLGRGAYLAAIGRAEQPVADADDAVAQAVLRAR